MKLFKRSKPGSVKKSVDRELLEAERVFQEGVSSLKDLIAPSAMDVEANYIQVSDKFARTFFVLTYPRFLSSNWLSSIINMDQTMDISMFVYPMETDVIMKKLRNKVGQLQSTIALDREKGNVRDPMLETAYQDVEELRNRLQQGTERYFKFSLYFTIYADDLKTLDKISSNLESTLGAKLIVAKRSVLQSEQGFNSTLPLGNDELAVSSNMNTGPLSTTFPFVSSELTSNDGILYGVNRHNNSLIIFDRFQMENANSVVFAKSGAGKSYAVKLEILRSMMLGVEVIVIDPESEYKHLAETVGGTYISMSLNARSRINPFDLPKASESDEPEDILRSSVINLVGLMNLMLGKLSPSEEAIMDRALWETYASHDITPQSDFKNAKMPTMSDLVNVLSGIEGGDSLASRLGKFTDGTFAGIFNQPTNINLDNQLVVFSVRDLEDTLRPIAIFIILNFIWSEIRSSLKKRILVVDEAWWMMQYEDSARFLFSIVKRARKYYLGVTTITQDVSDFLQSPYGKPVVTNSSMQLLLKQSPAAVDIVSETFFLTQGEKYLLLESEVGEGIFFAGLKHVAIRIVASYTEDQIITTDPSERIRMEEEKQKIKQDS